MTPFRERNPVPIGIAGLLVLALALVAAFNVQRLPLIGGGTTYHAELSDASGLGKGDDVRVAGVKVGQVTGIRLAGDHVDVAFRVRDGLRLGTRTGASVRIKTLLGQKYLAVEPDGPGRLPAGAAIPVARTRPAFDVPQAFQGLASRIDRIDTEQLARSFDTIAATFKDSPPEVTSALTGLQRLARTIASRDDQLRELLRHADGVTGVLAARDAELVKLVDDGDLLLRVVEQRRAAIHRLLVGTTALSRQLVGLVRDNQARLGPALAHLHQVVAILQRNEASIDRTLKVLAPFVRNFADALGNGRWFDTIVANIPPAPDSPGVGGGG
jgi:phospholipid/cholesterol/gamma-HCH transport system substrate-binding protein